MRRLACLAILFAMWSIPAGAATIAQILAQPSTYEGRHVNVSGTVEHLQLKISQKGNEYFTFMLCNGQCVHVFGFGAPNVDEGETTTVNGTYATVRKVGNYTFYNEIDVDEGSI